MLITLINLHRLETKYFRLWLSDSQSNALYKRTWRELTFWLLKVCLKIWAIKMTICLSSSQEIHSACFFYLIERGIILRSSRSQLFFLKTSVSLNSSGSRSIRGQYSGYVTCLDQSEATVQVTWSVLTNQRSVFTLLTSHWLLLRSSCWASQDKPNSRHFFKTLNFGLNLSHGGKLEELWSVVKDGVNHNRNYEVTRGIFSPEQTKNLLFVSWLFFL